MATARTGGPLELRTCTFFKCPHMRAFFLLLKMNSTALTLCVGSLQHTGNFGGVSAPKF